MIWRFLSFHLFQILAEEHFQFIKWYIVTLATIVEIAMRGIGDDEQLFVLWHEIGLTAQHEIRCLDTKKVIIVFHLDGTMQLSWC